MTGQPDGILPPVGIRRAEEEEQERILPSLQVQGLQGLAPPTQPYETEQWIRSRLKELDEERRARDAEFLKHAQAQGQLQELAQESLQHKQQQEQVQQAGQMNLLLTHAAARMPDPMALQEATEQIHTLGPGMDPEDYQALLGRVGRIQRLAEIRGDVRQRSLKAIADTLGQELEEESTVGGRLSHAARNVVRGLLLQEPETRQTGAIRRLLDEQGKLSFEWGRRAEEVGLSRDLLQQLIGHEQARLLEEARLEEGQGMRGFRAEVAGLGSMLVPFAAAEKLAAKGVQWLVRGTTMAETATGMARLYGKAWEKMVGYGGLGALGALKPLDDSQQFLLSQLSPEAQARAEQAFRTMNAAQLGPMLLLYQMAGVTGGRLASKIKSPMLGQVGGAVGTAALFPMAGEIGHQMMVDAAQMLAPISDRAAVVADLFAQEHPGVTQRLLGSLRKGEWDDAYEAAKEYARAAGSPMVAFSALGVLRGFGGKLSPDLARRVQLEVQKDIDASARQRAEAMTGPQRPEFRPIEARPEAGTREAKEAMQAEAERQIAEIAPTPEEARRQEARTVLEKETGGAREADIAIEERLLASRVKRPAGVEKKGETLKERREEVREAREILEEKDPESKEIRALEREELALDYLERATRAEKSSERLLLEERAENLLQAAERLRKGEEVEGVPLRVEPKKARQRILEREIEAYQREPEIAEQAVGEMRAAREVPRETATPARLPRDLPRRLEQGEPLTRPDLAVVRGDPRYVSRLSDAALHNVARQAGLKPEGVERGILEQAVAPGQASTLNTMRFSDLRKVADVLGVRGEGRTELVEGILEHKRQLRETGRVPTEQVYPADQFNAAVDLLKRNPTWGGQDRPRSSEKARVDLLGQLQKAEQMPKEMVLLDRIVNRGDLGRETREPALKAQAELFSRLPPIFQKLLWISEGGRKAGALMEPGLARKLLGKLTGKRLTQEDRALRGLIETGLDWGWTPADLAVVRGLAEVIARRSADPQRLLPEPEPAMGPEAGAVLIPRSLRDMADSLHGPDSLLARWNDTGPGKVVRAAWQALFAQRGNLPFFPGTKMARWERYSRTLTMGPLKSLKNPIIDFFALPTGKFGKLATDLNVTANEVIKVKRMTARLIDRLPKDWGIKPGSEEAKKVTELWRHRHEIPTDAEYTAARDKLWAEAPENVRRAAEETGKLLDTLRDMAAESTIPAVERLADIGGIRRQAEVHRNRAAELRAQAEQAQAQVPARTEAARKKLLSQRKLLKARRGKLIAKIKEAERKGEDAASLKERLATLEARIQRVEDSLIRKAARRYEGMQGRPDPERLLSQAKAAERTAKRLEGRANGLERILEEMRKEWGILKNYVPSIADFEAYKQLASVVERHGGTAPQPHEFQQQILQGLKKWKPSVHQKRRKGKIEDVEIEDPFQILAIYMDRMIPTMAMHRYIADNFSNIYGRLTSANVRRVVQPYGGEAELLLLDGKTPAYSRGSFLKLKDGSYVSERDLSPKTRSRMTKERNIRRLAGLKGMAGGAKRVVLIDTKMQMHGDGSQHAAPLSQDGIPQAVKSGRLVEMPLSDVQARLFTREGGFQQLADPPPNPNVKRPWHHQTETFLKFQEWLGEGLGGIAGKPDQLSRKLVRGTLNAFLTTQIGTVLNPFSALAIGFGATVANLASVGATSLTRNATLPLEYIVARLRAKLYRHPSKTLADVRKLDMSDPLRQLFPLSEKMVDPKATGRRLWKQEAFADFDRSVVAVGTKGFDFRDFASLNTLGKSRLRARGSALRHFLQWGLIDTMEWGVRSQAYLSVYVDARAQGRTRQQAADLAERVTIATHGLFSRTLKSKMLLNGIGALFSALTGWFQHYGGVTMRLGFGVREGKRVPLEEGMFSDPAFVKETIRQAKLGGGFKQLYRQFAMTSAATMIGAYLGFDWARYAGGTIRDWVFIGDKIAPWLRGDDDAEPKAPKTAEEALQMLLDAMAFNFSNWPTAIPAPIIAPLTSVGPAETIVGSAARIAEGHFVGDDVEVERGRDQFVRSLMGRAGRTYWDAFTAEPTPEGDAYNVWNFAKTRIVNRIDKRGMEYVAEQLLGPPIGRAMDWESKMMARHRADKELREAKQEKRGVHLVHQEILDIAEGLGIQARSIEDLQRQGVPQALVSTLQERMMDEAEQRFQRRYGMSLRELRDKKEPLTAVDRERVKNFASEWNELVDESRLLAYKARTFAPREMDVLYMANRSKNESVKLLTRLLRDEQQPLPKERFTVLLQLLIGKSRARKGISGVAEWSLQALRKDVFEDFRDAWMQAAERWRK